jgi:DNA-binding transcriptional ArsR family regulator
MDRASNGETDRQAAEELDVLVRYVTEPRQLGSIIAQAMRVGQPVRSQLAKLVECGRLTQPRDGVFAPAGFVGSIAQPGVSLRENLEGAVLAARLVALVDRPMLLRDVRVGLGEGSPVLPWVVTMLVTQGGLCQPECGILAPVGHDPSKTFGNGLVAMSEIRALLATPCRIGTVAAALGLTRPAAARYLAELEQTGKVVRLDGGLHVLAGSKRHRGPPTIAPVVLHRPQPIRDAILAYLTEPRRALDIAAHIERPIATATGHLAAMKRRGLVVSVRRGVYAQPDRRALRRQAAGELVVLEIAV